MEDQYGIFEAALAGRFETLLIEADRPCPGRIDASSGEITTAGPAHPEVDDVFDDGRNRPEETWRSHRRPHRPHADRLRRSRNLPLLMTSFARLHALLVDGDELAQVCRDLPESACREQPHNYGVHESDESRGGPGRFQARARLSARDDSTCRRTATCCIAFGVTACTSTSTSRALLAWIIGSKLEVYIELFGLSVDSEALREGATPYLIGFLAAVGLFFSVLIHELGHSVVGLRYDLKVQKITLWILGGMAQFERMPRRPGAEAVVAIAGPVTSYAVGICCWLLLRSLPQDNAAAQFVVAYLMYMNVILVTFNLLPALPLDGGRMLRSVLAMRMSHFEATRHAVNISKFLALFLGLFGFMYNPLMILIALFIYMAGSGEAQLATITEMLQGVRVSDLMTREVKTLSPEAFVSELIDKDVPRTTFRLPGRG